VEKAYVAVGEKGTVAAAAAGAVAIATSARMPQGLAFIADHPFLYLVRDLSTGQILFAGQFTGR
jgi:serpin B